MRGAVVVALALSSCSLVVDLDGLRRADPDGGGGLESGVDALVVRCKGTSSCASPSVCCAVCTNDDAGGCPYTFGCMDPNASCGGFVIGCSDQGSCPSSQVCCAVVGPNNTYFVGSSCKTMAECNASAPSVLLCDPNASDPCPDGGVCKVGSSGSFADLYECQ